MTYLNLDIVSFISLFLASADVRYLTSQSLTTTYRTFHFGMEPRPDAVTLYQHVHAVLAETVAAGQYCPLEETKNKQIKYQFVHAGSLRLGLSHHFTATKYVGRYRQSQVASLLVSAQLCKRWI